jgi:hypothetical protein
VRIDTSTYGRFVHRNDAQAYTATSCNAQAYTATLEKEQSASIRRKTSGLWRLPSHPRRTGARRHLFRPSSARRLAEKKHSPQDVRLWRSPTHPRRTGACRHSKSVSSIDKRCTGMRRDIVHRDAGVHHDAGPQIRRAGFFVDRRNTAGRNKQRTCQSIRARAIDTRLTHARKSQGLKRTNAQAITATSNLPSTRAGFPQVFMAADLTPGDGQQLKRLRVTAARNDRRPLCRKYFD